MCDHTKQTISNMDSRGGVFHADTICRDCGQRANVRLTNNSGPWTSTTGPNGEKVPEYKVYPWLERHIVSDGDDLGCQHTTCQIDDRRVSVLFGKKLHLDLKCKSCGREMKAVINISKKELKLS